MISLPEIFLLLLTYLWGSIPFGFLLTKIYIGKNILELGSGNIGSTNVRRVAGKKISIITQLLDMLKGLLPVALFLIFDTGASSPYYIFMLALAAIIGHDFSLFLKFKGGKGVNTTLGASVLLAPYSVFIAVGIYFIVKWRSKYVSMGSIVLAIMLPVIELLLYWFTPTFYFLLISSILIILLHRQNISRLIAGNELKS
ncbi:acyl-phosphate glycerol 3-phosphate acyltransferase [Labilibaculum filiforme]|uniref:Glycerol-3-phosphate acyltransferase n=1 Tax=Labilibaculum filiforme TaxID=1940526 RepID=A0A2N3HS16_9BACT|nr:glycerol-3-phosphate 1-O-acyltransferase PlsY [Labilibaculum filiforme]PKQ60848.1 acyl-phosphate glycerol 3-phosphate acyltransferase [Labilibaculum filiforme]